MSARAAIWVVLSSVASLVLAILWLSPAGAQPKNKEDRQALIKRGAYLVNEVARCGDCHTPRDAAGKLDLARHLQGAKMWFRPTVRVGEFEDHAPDITLAGLAGKWAEEKMVKLLTAGKSDPPMPAYRLTGEDARAMTAYLRSLPGGGNREPDKRGERNKKRDDD
jgi:mono/diheme cytochrome c family protein